MGLVPICRKFSDKFTIITINQDLVRCFFRMCHNYRIIPVLFKLFVDFCRSSETPKFPDQLRYDFIASFTQKSLSLLNSRHGTGVFGNDKPQFLKRKVASADFAVQNLSAIWQTKVVHHKMLYKINKKWLSDSFLSFSYVVLKWIVN